VRRAGRTTVLPDPYLALDLGAGELSAMALALENPGHIIRLEDMLALRTATAAGLPVRGSLKGLLEAKSLGFVDKLEPIVNRMHEAGMWVSADVKQRVLKLAGELENKGKGTNRIDIKRHDSGSYFRPKS
ncbi:MAG: DUF3368 domain-containing protein, partial [Methylocella sp.]